MTLSSNHHEDLAYAKHLLEHPGLAVRIMDTVGVPFEKGLKYLPAKWNGRIQAITESALHQALNICVRTLDHQRSRPSSDRMHKMMAAVSGGAGGAFGLPALALELPISTTIMLRSIVDIARSEGEDISALESRLACLFVFALGGRKPSDDSADMGYFAVRAAMAKSVSEAAKYLTEKSFADQSAPVIIQLIARIAARFGVVVSEKMAAMAIPLVGAAGGVLINTVFMDHFQEMARGHFIVRRLEREYGREVIQTAYQAI